MDTSLRHAAARRQLTPEQRELKMPQLADENTVFAEGAGDSFSIGEISGEKSNYGSGVVLDANLFDNVRPRNWGKTLSQYVYENLAGTELTMYDEAGNPETVYLAKKNDRVQKDGAKNSHKVIEKLARYKGDNIRALATVQMSEVLETSKYEKSTDEHSHQWMDESGWTFRKVYLQDRSGNIYEATLNIANGKERNILYDINNIRKIDKAKATDGDVPSTENGRGSLINSGFDGSISESRQNINEDSRQSCPMTVRSPWGRR